MVHDWAKASDANGSAVRIVLLDYKKAFDIIDQCILIDEILLLNIPHGVARWVCDFLFGRCQRVNLSCNCFSKWGLVPSGFPQDTKLSPWLFLLMINDLHPSEAQA